jgi:endonuclease-3
LSRTRSDPDAKAFPWRTVLGRLSKHYKLGNWRVPYLNASSSDPFRVLISTVLSQRTRDEVTYDVAAHLFERFPGPREMAGATIGDLERLIHRVGFYKAKARALRDLSVELLDRFDGKVPPDLEKLVSLPMVGRKTANCVLVYGYNVPAIPVDTHVHRISQRLGVVRTRTPEETELALMKVVPRNLWTAVNPILVQHGQNICRPIGPKCPECPVRDLCKTGIASQSRVIMV